jgi:5,10-methylene-tetrahydrofolate dehydrogenase/methenyl tetrahydrofolate cyclohydrolase
MEDSNLLNPDNQEQLAKHKTRKPVVNEVDVAKIPNQQAWVFEVLAYCSDLGISPDQLIEQHKYWNKMAHAELEEAIKDANKK